MKKIIFLLALLFMASVGYVSAQTLSSQQAAPSKEYASLGQVFDFSNFDVAPKTANSNSTPNGSKFSLPLQFQYDVETTGTAAVVRLGNKYYVARWNLQIIHRYNLDGTADGTIVVPGIGTAASYLRCMTTDGTHVYGGIGTGFIYKMDFTTQTLVQTITVPAGITVRHCSYDPTADSGAGGFWIGNWDNNHLVLVRMNGTEIRRFTYVAGQEFASMYGTAFDNVTPGGPYIWGITAVSAADAMIKKFKTSDLTMVDSYNMVTGGLTLTGQTGGGMCITTDMIAGTTTLMAVVQNIKLYGWKLAGASLYTNDLAASSLSVNFPLQWVGGAATYGVTVANTGNASQNSYTVQLLNATDNVLATQPTTTTIAPDASTVVNLNYAPTAAGSLQVKGKVILVGDENPANDVTATSTFKVYAAQPMGYCTNGALGGVGTGTTPNILSAAIYYPAANMAPFAGKNLTQIELGLPVVPTTINGCSIWIRSSLTGANLYTQNFTPTVNGWNTITLTTPYPLTAANTYIGYTVNAFGGGYPLGTTSNAQHANGMHIQIAAQAWSTLAASSIAGNNAIIGVVEGGAPPVTYTVTFNANGGTGTMANQTFTEGIAQALTANAFTRTNFTFAGWNTVAGGTGTAYTNQQSITVAANMTLFAQWTAAGDCNPATGLTAVQEGATNKLTWTMPAKGSYTEDATHLGDPMNWLIGGDGSKNVLATAVPSDITLPKPESKDIKLSYINGALANVIGNTVTGTNYYVSGCINFTAPQMASFVGGSLHTIRVAMPSAANMPNYTSSKVWVKGALNGAIIYQQTYTGVLGNWQDVVLTTPQTLVAGAYVVGVTHTFTNLVAQRINPLWCSAATDPYQAGGFNYILTTNATLHEAGATWNQFTTLGNLGIEGIVSGVTLPANDLAAISLTTAGLQWVGNPTTYAVTVNNAGTASQNNYTVQLLDVANNVLATQPISTALAAGANNVVNLNYTPTTAGNLVAKGKVILVGDQNPANDVTSDVTFKVYAAQPMAYCTNGALGGVGTGTTPNSLSAAIYYSAANMTPFVGKNLIQFELGLPVAPATINTCSIWIRSTLAGANLYTQNFTPSATGWNTITLTTPYPLTAANIYIGYTVNAFAGGYPLGTTEGTQNSNAVHIAIGTTWTTLTANSLPGNNAIIGVVEGGTPPPVATVNVFRNGTQIAANVTGATWIDPTPVATSCYTVRVNCAAGGNSVHSNEACVTQGGGNATLVSTLPAALTVGTATEFTVTFTPGPTGIIDWDFSATCGDRETFLLEYYNGTSWQNQLFNSIPRTVIGTYLPYQPRVFTFRITPNAAGANFLKFLAEGWNGTSMVALCDVTSNYTATGNCNPATGLTAVQNGAVNNLTWTMPTSKEATNYTNDNFINATITIGKEIVANAVSIPFVQNPDGTPINLDGKAVVFEDVESHTNFAVNSPGSIGWKYYNPTTPTYGFTGITFPGTGTGFGYIVFVPSATTPVMDPGTTPAIQPKSGSKFFASFAYTTVVNNNFIVSPVINSTGEFTFSFWAKTYMSDYGLERMKVRYSTTTDAQASFTNYLAGTASTYLEVPVATWNFYTYNVPATAKYVAIQCVSDDAFVFMVDDITITTPGGGPTTYTVTFNANGGTGTMANQTFTEGVAQALTANAFTRTNFTFAGWNTVAGGTGTAYTNQQSITVAANMTLFAQWTPVGGGDQVLYEDKFDAYTVGKLVTQNSTNWTTWSGPGGTAEDPTVVTEQALSTPNSVKFTGDNDLVFPIANLTTGKYKLELDYYVPSTGLGAYFNVLHSFAGASSTWATEIYFRPDGTGYQMVGTSTVTTNPFTFPTNAWFHIIIDIDMDAVEAKLTINGNLVKTWPFNWSANAITGVNQLGGMNFYAAYPGSTGGGGTYFIDNFKFSKPTAPPPTATVNVFRNGTQIAANVTGTTWTDPTPTVTSCYTVRVNCAAGGTSAMSNESCVIQGGGACDPATNLTAVRITGGNKLDWNTPAKGEQGEEMILDAPWNPALAGSLSVANSNVGNNKTIVNPTHTPTTFTYNDGKSPIAKGTARIRLTCGDVWGDGSGYQFLGGQGLYGTTIPATGPLTTSCPGSAALYALFTTKIPTNADGNCSTSNIVFNGTQFIDVTSGTMDYCITNPTPGDRIWIASGALARGQAYNFEDGKEYKFSVAMSGSNDLVSLVIEGGTPPPPATDLRYCTDNIDDGVGTGGANTFSAAITFTAADLTTFVGKTITKLKIGIGVQAPGISATSIWIRNTLTGANLVSKTTPLVVGWNEITLDAPFTIAAGATLALGYTCTVTGGYPLGTSTNTQNAAQGGNIAIGTAWTTLAANSIPGNLTIIGICEGGTPPANYTANIYRDGVKIAGPVTGKTYTDNIPPSQGVCYKVELNCPAGGVSAMSNEVCLDPVTDPTYPLPYYSVFETQAEFDKWKVFDLNGGTTWTRNSAEGWAQYAYHSTLPGNDWIITPGLIFPEAGNYKMTLQYGNNSSYYVEKMKVMYGTARTPEGQTILVKDYPNILIGYLVEDQVIFTVAAPGTYYFGLHAYSIADQYNLYVRDIKIERFVANDLAAISVTGSPLPMVTKTYPYSITVKNVGANPQSNYVVDLRKADNTLLGTTTITEELAPNATKVVVINWTPVVGDIGTVNLKGRVTVAGDEQLINNETPLLPVTVKPFSYDEDIIIGTGTGISVQIPFNFYYNSSMVQSLYLASEIGIEAGLLKSIKWFYNNTATEAISKPVKVYMATTALTSLSAGWLPDNQFTLVYEGTANVPIGISQLTFTLTTPFVYTGGNLVIKTDRPMAAPYVNNVNAYTTVVTPTARTRHYYSDTQEYNGTQAGTTLNTISNIHMVASTEPAGVLVGTVTENGSPLQGVSLKLMPMGLSATTNAAGEYKFPYIPAGSYYIFATKYTYFDYTSSNFAIVVNETLTHNFEMQSLPQHLVFGLVKNADGAVIPGAVVKLTGFANYETTTLANGAFDFQNVYEAQNYTIKVTADKYQQYTANVNVVGNMNLGTIVLYDIAITPSNVVAVAFENRAEITWGDGSGSKVFRYDDGTQVGQLGFTGGTANGVMGPVHRTSTTLTSMSWYTTTEGGPHNTINLWVLALNASGMPTSTVLYTKMNHPNTDLQWNSWTFPTPIVCANGFMIAISYVGFAGIGIDGGTSSEWPFVPAAQYYAADYTSGAFSTVESAGFSQNFMLRAEGSGGKSLSFVANKGAANVQQPQQLVMVKSEIPTVTEDPYASNNSKVLQGYKVWRLPVGSESTPTNWVTLTNNPILAQEYTDNTWATIPTGTYKYAVRSVYTGNVVSNAALSNAVDKVVLFAYTINIATNAGDAPTGAVVKLVNNSNPTYTYTLTSGATGVTFPAVNAGTYTLTVTKAGFNNYSNASVIVNAIGSMNVQLIETIVDPYGLEITVTAPNALLTWNNTPPATGYSEDVESHTNFAINSAGAHQWKYYENGSTTYGFSGITFPGSMTPFAYIVFVPSATTPVMDPGTTPGIQPHGGNKYFACFATDVTMPNNHWIVTKELTFAGDFQFSFWAKTYMPDYGLERMKVLYSTTGSAQANFTNYLAGSASTYVSVPDAAWTKYTYTVPSTAKYIAIQCVSNDAFVFMVDDIIVGTPKQDEPKSFNGYTVFLDGNPAQSGITTTQHLFTNLPSGGHRAGVQANYSSGNSATIFIDFTIPVGIDENNVNYGIYPNPTTEKLIVERSHATAATIELFSAAGTHVATYETSDAKYEINVSKLSAGTYFIRVNEGEKSGVKSFVKN